jgi:putative flavoprotein involved in K+ transport
MSEIVIIGAGPGGLATAASLRRRGIRFRLVDRHGTIGGAYRTMDPEIVMASPSRLVGLPGAPAPAIDRYATAGSYYDYLEAYAHDHELVPEQGVVESVTRASSGYVLSLRSRDRVEEVLTRAIVFATGMFDSPVIPAIPGRAEIPAMHAAQWRATDATRARRLVIVGGASSAIEVAECAAGRGCKVTIAARKIAIMRQTILGVDPAFALLPVLSRIAPKKFCNGKVTVPGTDRGFSKLRRSGAIRVEPALVRIDGSRCVLQDGRGIDADLVVFATGYRYALPALPVDVALTPRGIPRCFDGQSVSHHGLWFVGLPCARSAASEYLYGIARDAEHVAASVAGR